MELGAGRVYLRRILAGLVVVALFVGYNWLCFRNFSTQEAMDQAQLARNLADGKGYTTLFVRPLSMYLVKQENEAKMGPPPLGRIVDYSEIKGMHPDISNPPVYPVLLAGLMKILPFDYEASTTKTFWSSNNHFYRFEPDFLISLFNQILFLTLVAVTFFWARRLFDARVAWLSAILLLCTDVLWRFSISGLSTMLLLLIFMALVWCLTSMERQAQEPEVPGQGMFLLAGLAGLLTGLGGLTRYAFGWLIIPVAIFLLLFAGPRRKALTVVTVVLFLAVLTPWVWRNISVSGLPFGTATYTALEDTGPFPEHQLERSLEPDFTKVSLNTFGHKFLDNTRKIFQNDLPKLGGTWVTLLFLTGLFLGFRNETIQRVRYFLLLCLGVLIVVQAMGRTQLSTDAPEINSENLLILLLPLIMVYGVSLFFVLLDQVRLPFSELRYFIVGAFGVFVSLPLIYSFLPPRPSPIAYPPYFPPVIQSVSNWMKPNELIMSDIPWAVAWYGQRQSVWLTLNLQPDFYNINDYQKAINALYLTPKTLDEPFVSKWVRSGKDGWGNFLIGALVAKALPPTFPLRQMPTGFLPEQLVLTDYQRWPKEGQ